ncbi:MAG: hypothetical protein IPN97_07140 [Saprospiraceae bacterium]|nr:hypothetical protein [Saprospiraceae bacterium]
MGYIAPPKKKIRWMGQTSREQKILFYFGKMVFALSPIPKVFSKEASSIEHLGK